MYSCTMQLMSFFSFQTRVSCGFVCVLIYYEKEFKARFSHVILRCRLIICNTLKLLQEIISAQNISKFVLKQEFEITRSICLLEKFHHIQL